MPDVLQMQAYDANESRKFEIVQHPKREYRAEIQQRLDDSLAPDLQATSFYRRPYGSRERKENRFRFGIGISRAMVYCLKSQWAQSEFLDFFWLGSHAETEPWCAGELARR